MTDWILVDEAQFLTADQVDQLARVVDDFGSNVICYGLRTDFRSNLFEGSRRLFEIADTIDEIKSTCTCGRKTTINARIGSNGDFVEEGAQVEIGGDDRYMAVCATNAGATNVSSKATARFCRLISCCRSAIWKIKPSRSMNCLYWKGALFNSPFEYLKVTNVYPFSHTPCGC